MTFQKSSAKTRLYDLIHSLRSHLFVPVAAMAFLLMLTQNFTTLKWHMSLPVEERYEHYRYFFFDLNYDFFTIRLFLFVFGAVVGLMAFNFVNNKKMSNTFLSFNIKRNALFVNRCISSIIHIFLGILIPMLFLLIVNIYYLGFESIILIPWFYLLLAMFVYSFLGFAFAALGSISAGSTIEAIIYTVLFYVAPYMFLFGPEQLFNNYLQGYPLTRISSLRAGWMPAEVISKEIGIINRFSIINPIAYLDTKGSANSYNLRGNHLVELGYMNEGSKINIDFTKYFPVLLWAIIAVCMLGFALFVLNKRKAENAGGFGKNKIMRAFAVTLFSIFAFCAVSGIFAKDVALSLVVSLIAFVAAYFILELLILRNLQEVKSGLIKLPLISGLLLLILLIPFSGGFGYSKRVPQASEVKEIYTTVLYGDSIYYASEHNGAYGPITSDNDKTMILDLQNTLIKENPTMSSKLKKAEDDDDRLYGFYIQYQLNNGKKISRYYPLDVDLYKDTIIKTSDSDFSKEFIKNMLITREEGMKISEKIMDIFSGKDNETSLEEMSKLRSMNEYYFTFDMLSEIGTYLIDKGGISNGIPISEMLSEKEIYEFKKAIVNDTLRLGAEKVLYPKTKVIGAVLFNNYDFPMLIEDSEKNHPDAFKLFNAAHSGSIVQITEDMTETLEFLKAKDMLKIFENDKKIISAAYAKLSKEAIEKTTGWYMFEDTKRFSALFMTLDGEDRLKNSIFEMVSDISKAQKLYDNAYLNYAAEKDGYIIQFNFNDKTSSVLYVPADKFPL